MLVYLVTFLFNLKLIFFSTYVVDFLDELPEPENMSLNTTRKALLDCCVSFGSSQHDVNISLTATGMLWTIADQDPAPSSVDVSIWHNDFE